MRGAPVHLQLEFLHEHGLFPDVALSVVAGAPSQVSNDTQKFAQVRRSVRGHDALQGS